MKEEPFYIVALGASAGGHQPIWEFFACLLPMPQVAFIIIQHLKIDAVSIADQLLSKYTLIPVTWAMDGQRVVPNHIYILPPGKYMTLQDGRLHLINRDPHKKINQAIDIFLKSLSQQQDSHGIGIILSGAGSDGANGAVSMHQHGGSVFVQDPASAEFTSMPYWAIRKDHVQVIAAPKELAQAVHNVVNTL